MALRTFCTRTGAEVALRMRWLGARNQAVSRSGFEAVRERSQALAWVEGRALARRHNREVALVWDML
jgi:hypothetical protein